MGAKDSYENLDFEPEREESSIANVAGTMRLLHALMLSITQAEINRDWDKLLRCLDSMFTWLHGYFEYKDIKEIQQLVDNTVQHMNEYVTNITNGAQQKARINYNTFTKNLREIKIKCAIQLKKANLMTPTREHGSDLFN